MIEPTCLVRALAPAFLWLGAAAGAHAATSDENDLWLEAPHDPAALAWASRTTEDSSARLRALPVYAKVKADLTEALKAGATEPDVAVLGPRALRFLRSAEHPYGLLQTAQRDADGVPGAWRTVLDVGALRQREGVPFELQAYGFDDACLAPEYRRCLLRLSPGGGDEVELREFDLDTAGFVDDGFRVPRARAFAQWMGPDSLLVEHTAGGAPKTAAGWPASVGLWRRGQPLEAAREVYRAESSDAIVQLMAVGDGAARQGVIVRAITYSSFDVHLVDAAGVTRQLPFPRTLKPMGVHATGSGAVIAQLAEPATIEGRAYPAEAVLAYTADPSVPEGRRTSLVFQPAEGEFVGGREDIAATDDEVLIVANRRLVPRVLAVSRQGDGWSVREVLQGAPGDTISLRAGSDGDLVVATSGFVTPRRQELYRKGRPLRRLATDPTLFDAIDYVTEIRSATSRDGTTVDYFLLHPRSPAHAGPQPTLMTGYGAFGISARPGYFDYLVGGPSFRLWLQRGGALVIPAARGGGERGEDWHRAAMREKRQNSYDDFIAVARALVDDGFTAPAKLGVFGMSNGGLLSATLGTQRPDLFGAVVSDVPLADMLRMKHMGMGAAWLNEYGDPADPAMERALRAYSPLHNVRAGTHYPPFLVTISTEDNRVGPGHARKLAARLAAAGAPTYFLEDQEGGHGVSDPFRNPELMALRMTFLIGTLMPQES